nr:hypothetical protein [Tanacetum cinerariifolium]
GWLHITAHRRRRRHRCRSSQRRERRAHLHHPATVFHVAEGAWQVEALGQVNGQEILEHPDKPPEKPQTWLPRAIADIASRQEKAAV